MFCSSRPTGTTSAKVQTEAGNALSVTAKSYGVGKLKIDFKFKPEFRPTSCPLKYLQLCHKS